VIADILVLLLSIVITLLTIFMTKELHEYDSCTYFVVQGQYIALDHDWKYVVYSYKMWSDYTGV